jgi:hypothetical protein
MMPLCRYLPNSSGGLIWDLDSNSAGRLTSITGCGEYRLRPGPQLVRATKPFPIQKERRIRSR